MGSLDPAKVLVVLVIALVVLGPERLPDIARKLGRGWRELTRLREQVTEEVRAAIPDADLPTMRRPGTTISGFLSDLTTPRTSAGVDAAVARAPRTERVESEPSITFDDPSMN